MDDDTTAWIAIGLFLVLIIGTPFIIVFSISACIACSRTRKWKKEKALRATNKDADVEMDPLVEEEELYLDSEDEAELAAEKAEDSPDWDLTPRQKFRKEFKRAFKGKNLVVEAKKKEREERSKIAKAVAKEIARLERRRERREHEASGSSGQMASNGNEDFLPSYNNAVAGDRKI